MKNYSIILLAFLSVFKLCAMQVVEIPLDAIPGADDSPESSSHLGVEETWGSTIIRRLYQHNGNDILLEQEINELDAIFNEHPEVTKPLQSHRNKLDDDPTKPIGQTLHQTVKKERGKRKEAEETSRLEKMRAATAEATASLTKKKNVQLMIGIALETGAIVWALYDSFSGGDPQPIALSCYCEPPNNMTEYVMERIAELL